MSDADRIVDWALAERTAVAFAGARAPRSSGELSATELEAACERALGEVAAYAGLPAPADPPVPLLVGRAEWARNSLDTLAAAAKPLERRVASEISLPGPLDGVARRLIGAGTGAEAGLAVGYAARRVLGQYDVDLFGAGRPAKLLFVAPNIEAACSDLGADPELFIRWIALHETTHVVQFEAIPWLAPHLRRLAEELLSGAVAGVEISRIGDLLRRLVREPRALVRELLRGGLAQALADPHERQLIERLQATMSVIEGHAEHVMDACIADEPRLGELRARLEQRRAGRGGLGEIVARLFGMELKLRQYEVGKQFWDAVVTELGDEALERAWRSPTNLPDLGELENPERWVARTASVAVRR